MLQRPHPHHRGPLELLLAQTINQRPFYSNYTQGGTALSCPHLAAHTLLFIPPPTIQFASLTLFFLFPQALLLTPLLPQISVSCLWVWSSNCPLFWTSSHKPPLLCTSVAHSYMQMHEYAADYRERREVDWWCPWGGERQEYVGHSVWIK